VHELIEKDDDRFSCKKCYKSYKSVCQVFYFRGGWISPNRKISPKIMTLPTSSLPLSFCPSLSFSTCLSFSLLLYSLFHTLFLPPLPLFPSLFSKTNRLPEMARKHQRKNLNDFITWSLCLSPLSFSLFFTLTLFYLSYFIIKLTVSLPLSLSPLSLSLSLSHTH
jgi:hypothetical protein